MTLKTLTFPITTRIYHINAPATKPILIFIPGNPGFIEYYTRYLKLLSQSTGYEILGISYAGFAGDDTKRYTLKEQVEHKVKVIREFINDKDREIYILGHSVGSWIMERVIDSTPELNYKFIGFITPAIIDIHKSKQGSILYSLVQYAPWFVKVLARLTNLVKILPDFLVDKLLNIIISTDFTGAKNITKEFLKSPDMVSQSLTLASEEMLTIQSDWEYHKRFLENYEGVNKWFFFAKFDHWVNEVTVLNIKKSLELVKNVSIDIDDEITHSFCLNQSDRFGEITLAAFNSWAR